MMLLWALMILIISSFSITCEQNKTFNYEHWYNMLSYDIFSNYNKNMRPTQTGSATEIKVSFEPKSLLAIDERSQTLSLKVWIWSWWNDPRLSWLPAQYGHIDRLFIPQSQIWTPPIIITNSQSQWLEAEINENIVYVGSDGDVWVGVHPIIHIYCDIEVAYYPFDVQTCTTKIMFLPYSTNELDTKPWDGPFGPMNMETFLDGGIWQTVGYYCHHLALMDLDWTRSALTYTLMLRRRPTYYVINIILPAMFLSFTTSAVFLLPSKSGEKMTLSMTGLVAMSVFLSGVADDLPQTSVHVCYLQVYLTFVLGLSALGVLLSGMVLKLHHRPCDVVVGPKTRGFVIWLKNMQGLGVHGSMRSSGRTWNGREHSDANSSGHFGSLTSINDNTNTQNTRVHCSKSTETPMACDSKVGDQATEENQMVTWDFVADSVDKVLFVFFSLIILVSSAILFPYIIIKGSQHSAPVTPTPFQCFNEAVPFSGSSF